MAKKNSLEIRDRITDFRRIPAQALKPHAQNWRIHPQYQRDMLRATLNQVGIADALIVYESERYGGLTIIDGHLRAEDYPQDWPCLVTDLTDEEADVLLLAHDPLAALAQTHQETYGELLGAASVRDEKLQGFFLSLISDAGGIDEFEDFRPPPLSEESFADDDLEIPELEEKRIILIVHNKTYDRFMALFDRIPGGTPEQKVQALISYLHKEYAVDDSTKK